MNEKGVSYNELCRLEYLACYFAIEAIKLNGDGDSFVNAERFFYVGLANAYHAMIERELRLHGSEDKCKSLPIKLKQTK